MIDYEAGAQALFKADSTTTKGNFTSLADHVQDAYRRKCKACVDAALKGIAMIEEKLFGVEFNYMGELRGFHVCAYSLEDAQRQIEAIAANGRVYGEIVQVIEGLEFAGPEDDKIN